MTSDRPELVDTHCHLNHEDLTADAIDVVDRARDAGVNRMVVVGFDVPSSVLAVSLAESLPGVFAAVAVHPHDARHYDSDAEAAIRRLAVHPRVVAIGEIGLDYHYDFSPVEAQLIAFKAQIGLACETGLPIIIHCREAYTDVMDILEDAANPRTIIMHCWAGSVEDSRRATTIGCCFGFGGLITFKNADAVRQAAGEVPADRLLVETDSPYMAPVPFRGKRNEPAYAALAAQRLAEIRGVSYEAIAALTTANAERAFPKLTDI